MPILRNNGTKDILVGNIIIKPNRTETTDRYSYHPDIEIVSHKPNWALGVTGSVKKDAISGTKTYSIPPTTKNIEITNMSGNLIKVYNGEVNIEDECLYFFPGMQRIIEHVSMRSIQIVIEGTAAEGEVIVIFLS